MTSTTAAKLVQDIEDFLVFKRALGYTYKRSELTLRSFQRYIEQQVGPHGRFAFDVEIERWLSRIGERKPITVGLELGVVRQLCLFRCRRDPHSFVPDHALAPVDESKFIPYIFSREEIHRILDAVRTSRHRTMPPTMLRTLILILYCTGLRLGEAVRLHLQDIDMARREFIIRESKGRTRIVPFRADLARQIRIYLSERCQPTDASFDSDAEAMFVRSNGYPLTVKAASCAIAQILRRIGIKPQRGRIGPRPYEFRHAFAVHRLTDWYRAGVDIHAKLPWLSAYMGHVDLLGTEVYLAATPELMQIASQRFHGRLQQARKDH
jgi:integrase/recombinase XerD